jgi:hypothetical protein
MINSSADSNRSRIDKLKTRLIESRDILNKVLDQVDGRWDVQVYSDGSAWTVGQLVKHLVDAHRGNFRQAAGIAEGQEIIPADFDIDRYNASMTRKTAEKTIETALEELRESHENLLAWVDTLDDERLEKQGRHATLSIMSVHDIIRIIGLHERDHAADIARVLEIQI